MKIFAYDPNTAKRGEQIGEMPRIHAYSNRDRKTCKLPRHNSDTQWTIATSLEDRNCQPVQFEQPVCFCLGQFTCGTDTSWEWVVYLPESYN